MQQIFSITSNREIKVERNWSVLQYYTHLHIAVEITIRYSRDGIESWNEIWFRVVTSETAVVCRKWPAWTARP